MLNFSPLSDRNLTLTGYIGPAQTAVSRRIAERLKRALVNVEQHIEERAEMSVDQVRERFGEARLKTLQSEVMDEIFLYRGAVINISGQTLLTSNHFQRMSETGPVICLVADLDAVLQRLHVAMGARYHSPHERGLALGHIKREWAARQLEGILELDTTRMNDAEMIDAVVELWQQTALQRI
jgi:shikimate kinase